MYYIDQYVNSKSMDINSNSLPPIIEQGVVDSVKVVYINFDIVYLNDTYYYKQTGVEYAKFNYEGIVDALVSYKYPIDKMQAVINNYLLDYEDAYAIEEFNKMQAWRKEAKEIAKEALDYKI